MNKRLLSPLGWAGHRIATPRVPFPGCRPCPSHTPKPHARCSTGVPAAFCDSGKRGKSRKAGACCMHSSSGSLAEGAPLLLVAPLLHLEHSLALQNPRHKAKIKGLCITLKNASAPSLLQFNCTSVFSFPICHGQHPVVAHTAASDALPAVTSPKCCHGREGRGSPPGGSAAKKKVVTFESISVTILRGGKIRSSSSLHNAGKY